MPHAGPIWRSDAASLPLGGRPSAWVWPGVVTALPAIWLTAGGGEQASQFASQGVLLGLGAGGGFTLQLHFLGLIPVVLGSLVRREPVSTTAAVGIGLSVLATILVMVGGVE